MTRLLVLGLDGGTDSVIRAAGTSMPNLAEMRRAGACGALRSTIPPITATAWPSMFTGWNPGRHGMLDFRPLDLSRPAGVLGAGNPDGFDGTSRFVGSAPWRGHSVWDIAGVPCAIVGVPMTYPPWPVNGCMTAGFPLPDYHRDHTIPPTASTRPPLLEGVERLESMPDDQLASHCLDLIERQRTEVMRHLADPATRLIVAVFQATDFAQHRLWKYLADPLHPLCQALLDMYRRIDALIGEARTVLAPEGSVMVVSDHGFGPHPRTLVATDAVLAQAGLITPSRLRRVDGMRSRLSRSPRLRLAVRRAAALRPAVAAGLARIDAAGQGIDRRTAQAHRYPLYGPVDGVVVNLRGRSGGGTVDPGRDYERVRDRVIEALSAVTDGNGCRPVEWVGRREQVFRGDHTRSVPDVIAVFGSEYKPVSGLDPIFRSTPSVLLDRYSGVHTMNGIIIAAGPGIPAGSDLGQRDLVDVAPTILGLLGYEPPDPCDGSDMFRRARSEAAGSIRPAAPDIVAANLSLRETDAIEHSLRSLGYLE